MIGVSPPSVFLHCSNSTFSTSMQRPTRSWPSASSARSVDVSFTAMGVG